MQGSDLFSLSPPPPPPSPALFNPLPTAAASGPISGPGSVSGTGAAIPPPSPPPPPVPASPLLPAVAGTSANHSVLLLTRVLLKRSLSNGKGFQGWAVKGQVSWLLGYAVMCEIYFLTCAGTSSPSPAPVLLPPSPVLSSPPPPVSIFPFLLQQSQGYFSSLLQLRLSSPPVLPVRTCP